MVKNPPVNARDVMDAGLIPGLGRSPEEGNGNPFQYSCLGNPVDKGAWQATVHRVAELVTVCASSSPAFLMMYFAYKLNKHGDNIQP